MREPGVPAPRLLAAAGVAVEALALVAYAVGVVVVAVRDQAAERLGAVVLGLTVAVLAAGLGAVARGLTRAQGWARTPALLWQLLQVAVALPALASAPWLAVPAVVLAVATAAAVVTARDGDDAGREQPRQGR